MLNDEEAPPTGRQAARDARRAQLLSVALAEFNERGWHGASTRSITARAGISSGLLFHYFASKEALYEELVRIGTSELVVDPAAVGDDPIPMLLETATRVLSMLQETPEVSAMFVFMAYAERHPELTPGSGELLRQHDPVKATTPLIRRGQRSGHVRSGEPRALASLFWSSLQGVAEQHAAFPKNPLPRPEWLVAHLRPIEELT